MKGMERKEKKIMKERKKGRKKEREKKKAKKRIRGVKVPILNLPRPPCPVLVMNE